MAGISFGAEKQGTPPSQAQKASPPQKPDRGFAYVHHEVREVPWSVHVMKIDRSHQELELDTMMGLGLTIGMGVVSEQARAVPAEWGRPIAAINGDFFHATRSYPGDPDGLQIVHGELVSGPNPSRICFWVDAAGNPHRNQVISEFHVTWPDKSKTPIGLNEERDIDAAVLFSRVVGPSSRTYGGQDLVLERNGSDPWLPLHVGQTYNARVREVRANGNGPLNSDVVVLSLGPRINPRPPKIEPGMVVRISTETSPALPGAVAAMGGGPTLIEGGKIRKWPDVHGAELRHPRSAVGWNKDFIYMVEVDGRQRSLSVGMTLLELSQYMKNLGCEEAVNLDGGGSATMWVLGNVMNSPCQGMERPAANSLVLIQKQQAKK